MSTDKQAATHRTPGNPDTDIDTSHGVVREPVEQGKIVPHVHTNVAKQDKAPSKAEQRAEAKEAASEVKK